MSDSLPSDDILEISPRDLNSLLRDSVEIRLIDCREEDEFALCRLEGAELVPLSRFAELADPVFPRDGEAPVVIYCHHGMRSLQATAYLRRKGRRQVWSLMGGIDRWSIEIDDSIPRY